MCLLGTADTNLRALARFYKTKVVVRDDCIRLSGPRDERAELVRVLDRLIARCRKGEAVGEELVEAEIRRARAGSEDAAQDTLTLKTPRKPIVARTPNQESYLKAIEGSEIVFAIGPAGTGKTYLAVAAAVDALSSGRTSRIVLTRPAVEAGESLGYLPGTFKDKVDPYLRPLYDALFDMMPLERVRRLIEEEVIEVAPLAFMRGRTLSEARIILDEAQNTTSTQMRMFLTRLGWNSKAVVTGDVTQIDLEHPLASGLIEAEKTLKGVRGISMVHFTEKDVVRPQLVSRIIRAYNGQRAKGQGPMAKAERSRTRDE
ncbi:MAG: PhoH family protein [candidate division WOR-3 bacterium]|nr:MAG: PhoH family protein [candidate division WOR-3 bacterium]